MDTKVCLNTLQELAVDTGYEVREIEQSSNQCAAPASSQRRPDGSPILIVNREFSIEDRAKAVSTCLQGNPQLAYYALTEKQETALRKADTLAIPESAHILSIDDYRRIPQTAEIRRAA